LRCSTTARLIARSFSSSSKPPLATEERPPAAEERPHLAKAKQAISNLFHGDREARVELEQTHSKLLERGKFVHEKQVHSVKPEAWDDYCGIISEEYARIAKDPQFKANLFGSWNTEIGSLDTAIHIWEFNNYPGYTETMQLLSTDPTHTAFKKAVAPMLRERSNQMLLEFNFWDGSAPATPGGIYELRTYTLKPGRLLEWEQEWHRGLEARRKFVQPIGAWFSQLGDLNVVHHMWAYPNLQVRKKMREAAWQVDGWAQTVVNTVRLVDKMECQILRPMSTVEPAMMK